MRVTIADPHADPETSFEIMIEPTKSCNFLSLQGLFKSRRGESNPGPTDYESATPDRPLSTPQNTPQCGLGTYNCLSGEANIPPPRPLVSI